MKEYQQLTPTPIPVTPSISDSDSEDNLVIRVTCRTVRNCIKKIREPTEEVIEDIDYPTHFRQEPQHELREDTESDIEDVEEDEEENR